MTILSAQEAIDRYNIEDILDMFSDSFIRDTSNNPHHLIDTTALVKTCKHLQLGRGALSACSLTHCFKRRSYKT